MCVMLASKIPFFIYDNADMFTNVVLTDQSFHLYLRYSAFSRPPLTLREQRNIKNKHFIDKYV